MKQALLFACRAERSRTLRGGCRTISLVVAVALALALALGGRVVSPVQAQESVSENQDQTLPDPLTLQQAMDLMDDAHPSLLRAQAGELQARSAYLDAKSDYGLQAYLEAKLGYVEPNRHAALQQHDDHSLSLTLQKRLTDFGRQADRLQAAEAEQRGYALQYTNAQRQQRLNIIQRFFDVIEADLQAAWHSEAMQVEFLRLEDRIEQTDLEESSELERLRSDADYQASLALSNASESLQRSRRSMLAQSLNRPEALPSTLIHPELAVLERKVPEDANTLMAEALMNNAGLRGLQARLEAAQKNLQAARALDGPVLDAQGRLASRTRRLGGADEVQLGLVLTVPLSTGGRTQAEIMKSRAELLDLQAQRAALDLDIRQRVLELWQALQIGRYEHNRAQAEMELASMELEQSRILFEQEAASNLGDAMAKYTRAEYLVAVADHKLAMAWLKLDAVLGRPIDPFQTVAQQRPTSAE